VYEYYEISQSQFDNVKYIKHNTVISNTTLTGHQGRKSLH